jgi:uncharacterized protein (DUF305 family)
MNETKLHKRITGWALSAVVALSLIACSEPAPSSPTAQRTTSEHTTAHNATPSQDTHAQGEHNMPYDAEFLDMMIHHHEMALDMSQDALQNAQSAEVKSLAQKILDDQQAEIARMEGWRKAWYPDVPRMKSEEMAHHMGAVDMSGEGSFDQRFLREMIKHHQDALKMATDAQKKAEHSELREMATDIISKQQAEIEQMEELRRTASL